MTNLAYKENNDMNQLAPYSFDATILREYDVRGIVGETLSELDAFALGAAFGTYVANKGGKRVCVGYDGRLSSPAMSKALIDGLTRVGIDVTNVGLGPTPMVYFTVKDRQFDAGVMVTGSHNPSNYNGFKMTLLKEPVFGEAIQEIGKIAAEGKFRASETAGTTDSLDVKESYIERLMADFVWPEGKEMKIAWDAGNGAAGDLLNALVSKLPGEHILIYDEIDGTFPNHHPDPTVDKNMQDLKDLVLKENCDMGIAFDGDGDRIGAIDAEGNILRCDRLMTLYAKEVLENNPGATIIGDVKCSQIMFDEISALGGDAVMWKTGHSLVKAKMAETNAPLAGELSGHIFFADHYYGFDDALYCAVRLLNIFGAEDTTLGARLAHLPETLSTPEIRVDVPEEGKHEIPEKIKAQLQSFEGDYRLIGIDGVRFVTDDGWWLIRASNTQNCLVIRLESTSEEGMARLKTILKDQLQRQGLDFEV